MGHGTPNNMNWAGLLQNLLVVVHIRHIMCDSVWFSIPEEQEPGILVGSLSKHFPPPFQLLTQEYFWLDKNTGNLYTTEKKTDREALCPEETKAEECIILHNAVVGPSGDLIQFPVIIEDINDNAPHFENPEIHLRVSEDVTVGTALLLDDQAQDRDARQNGELHYHLQDSDGVFSLRVEEDEPFIMLVVQSALDRETKDLYRMALVATDCASYPLSATAVIIVTVTDVDDNCPSFTSDSPHSVTVPGDAPKNMMVAQVTATDPDSGPNAAIVYSLSPKVPERVKKLFSLDSLTGYIRLTQDLQSDKSEELLLTVLAIASGHHCPPAVTQVTISMLPKANKELAIKIRFIAEHQNQTVMISENQPPTVLAILELEGHSSVTDSSLTIESGVPFTLSPQNGKYLLSTSKPLDHEMKREHHISVVGRASASDGAAIAPPWRVIRVMVKDVNDNAPRFLRSHYLLEVEENNQPGMSLLQITATDADSGHNSRVTYRLDKYTTTTFNIDPTTGQLSVLASLDRELQCEHKLTVRAQDSGSPPWETVATVSIRVLDQNDNAPVFPTPHFIFFVPEDIAALARVGAIGVADPDEGENGNTELHVVNSSGPFVVDSDQGTLRTTTNLDRETEGRYELYLRASDHGRPVALTSIARVTIFVEDINDNPPKVILPGSNSSCLPVSPETSAGTMVTKIHAIDKDLGLNSEITYTAVVSKPVQNSSPFQVDSRSGNVTVARQLLRRDLGMHHLFIVVRDGGKPAPLYATVWVNLLINESTETCHLDVTPTWTGTYDMVQNPSKASLCEVENTQLTLLVGAGMILASACLFVVTAVFCLKQRRKCLQNKRGHNEENEIPLSLKDKYHCDDY